MTGLSRCSSNRLPVKKHTPLERHFMFNDFNIPSDEEITRMAAERFAQAKASVTQPGRFIGVSLGEWLPRVVAAGVPIVPAQKIADIPRATWMRAEDGLESDAAFWGRLEAAYAKVPADHMLRWDACSGLSLKGAMAKGGAPGKSDRQELDWGDPRASDILYEFPSDMIPVWSRPWVEAAYIDNYPVEFRVFLQDSQVLGVASYYPQRALPATALMAGLADTCGALALRVAKYMDSRGEYPWMPDFEGRYEPGKVHATMDFLVTPGKDILFLEAGPPFGAGAHPCAFIDRAIEGVALELAPGARLR